MRLIRRPWVCFFVLGICLLSTPALAIGLYVERLQDPSVAICPYCHRVIAPGGIHQNAESILMTEFGGSLDGQGVTYTTEPGQANYLNVFVYRFQERQGGNFSVVRPASVGFHVHLFQEGKLTKVFVFDETQQPLSDNLFRIFTFLQRGATWITAGELAREGVHKAVGDFAPDLKAPGE